MKRHISAVVVTYNRKKLLKECLTALLSKTDNKCDIIVIDNASTDGTREYIKKLIDEVRVFYFNTGKNIGGAGGFNFGMKKAYEMGYEYFWLMDDDCIVEENTLMELMKAADRYNDKFGFLSSKVLWKDGSICKMNIPKQTFSKWMKDFDGKDQRIAMASFVSFFISRKIVKDFGYPIKDFFIWTDDWEYSRRISRKMPCYYVPSSVVIHKSKVNEGARIDTVDDRLDRFSYLYRNDVFLYNREGLRGRILLRIRLLLHFYRIYSSNKPDKSKRVNIVRDAIRDGKKFRPIIEYPER